MFHLNKCGVSTRRRRQKTLSLIYCTATTRQWTTEVFFLGFSSFTANDVVCNFAQTLEVTVLTEKNNLVQEKPLKEEEEDDVLNGGQTKCLCSVLL